jgi:hypothetical protein
MSSNLCFKFTSPVVGLAVVLAIFYPDRSQALTPIDMTQDNPVNGSSNPTVTAVNAQPIFAGTFTLAYVAGNVTNNTNSYTGDSNGNFRTIAQPDSTGATTSTWRFTFNSSVSAFTPTLSNTTTALGNDNMGPIDRFRITTVVASSTVNWTFTGGGPLDSSLSTSTAPDWTFTISNASNMITWSVAADKPVQSFDLVVYNLGAGPSNVNGNGMRLQVDQVPVPLEVSPGIGLAALGMFCGAG